jgi:predicted lactoylglutathione lyase
MMTKMIFVNLPVTDLARSKAFYEALGFTNNAQFSDGDSACMVVSEAINVMLLTQTKWRGFTNRPIPPTTSSEVMLAISCESREEVDRMNDAAAAHGGEADINRKQDLGFLYNRNLADPDGHVWEAVWMDPSAMSAAA